jgi:hypothetical protein
VTKTYIVRVAAPDIRRTCGSRRRTLSRCLVSGAMEQEDWLDRRGLFEERPRCSHLRVPACYEALLW